MTLHFDTAVAALFTAIYLVYSIWMFIQLIDNVNIKHHVSFLVLRMVKISVIVTLLGVAIAKGLTITIGGTL